MRGRSMSGGHAPAALRHAFGTARLVLAMTLLLLAAFALLSGGAFAQSATIPANAFQI